MLGINKMIENVRVKDSSSFIWYIYEVFRCINQLYVRIVWSPYVLYDSSCFEAAGILSHFYMTQYLVSLIVSMTFQCNYENE